MSTAMSTVSKRFMAGLVVLGLAITLAACDDGGTTSGDTSSMSLKLTDAPSPDLENAWVEITEIELQGTNGSTVLLDESTDLIELTALAGTTRDLVSDVAVASGEYSQLRIIVGAAAVEAASGDVFSRGGAAEQQGLTKTGDLQCPSCSQTGFKVNLPDGSVTLETESKVILLDFDVSETFGQQAGMSGMWVMNPLVRTSEFGVTGTVEGTVSTAEGVSFPTCGGRSTGVEDFFAELDDPDTGDKVAGTQVASDGSYAIQFLDPGDYATDYASPVTIEGDELSFDASASTDPVTVEEGSTATVDYTINGATCSTSSSG